MKKTITVRGLALGGGVPKVCVPLTGKTVMELLDEITAAKGTADLVEWRADYFEELLAADKLPVTLRILRGALDEMPLLFSYRTIGDGGKGTLAGDEYKQLCIAAGKSGDADLVDVELAAGEELCMDVLAALKRQDVAVVVSKHNFVDTPAAGEMVATLRYMQDLGADIPKLAVMAKSPGDLLAVLVAAEEYGEKHASGPFAAVAMGKLGTFSRVAGGAFGSAITFGYQSAPTALGQLQAGKLKEMLHLLYGGD